VLFFYSLTGSDLVKPDLLPVDLDVVLILDDVLVSFIAAGDAVDDATYGVFDGADEPVGCC